jgi:nitrate reductase gamma subunit
MSSTTLKEAERVMTICNACRYCEGFCAVFPAMELRRVFSGQDLKYLANLCHNCRGCYYACQYAPPHEFMVNIPRTLAELRQETYRESAWPRCMRGFFQNNGLVVALIAALGVTGVLLLTLLFQGHGVLFASHTGEGAFYRVIPYAAMVLPFTALGGLALLVGTGGLLVLKRRMDRRPAAAETVGMDMVFILLLLLTSLTGLLLLVLRTTPLMGSLLAIHLGFVLGLFVTMPYGKFVHGVYRYAALVRNAIEQARESREARRTPGTPQ